MPAINCITTTITLLRRLEYFLGVAYGLDDARRHGWDGNPPWAHRADASACMTIRAAYDLLVAAGLADPGRLRLSAAVHMMDITAAGVAPEQRKEQLSERERAAEAGAVAAGMLEELVDAVDLAHVREHEVAALALAVLAFVILVEVALNWGPELGDVCDDVSLKIDGLAGQAAASGPLDLVSALNPFRGRHLHDAACRVSSGTRPRSGLAVVPWMLMRWMGLHGRGGEIQEALDRLDTMSASTANRWHN